MIRRNITLPAFIACLTSSLSYNITDKLVHIIIQRYVETGYYFREENKC